MKPNTDSLTIEIFDTKDKRLHRMHAAAARVAVGLSLDLPLGPQGELQPHTIIDVRQIDEKSAQVVVSPQRAATLHGPQLRFVIGARPSVGSNFSILHGERDLSPLLDVKSVAMRVDTNTRRTVVTVELLAGLDVFAQSEFLREGVTVGDLDGLVRVLAAERTIMEVEPDNMEGLSRRHLVQLARSYRAFVERARAMLKPVPAELCATCNLPAEVHGHGEGGPESHAFERQPVIGLAVAHEPASAPAGAPLKHLQQASASTMRVVELDENGRPYRPVATIAHTTVELGEEIVFDRVAYVVAFIGASSLDAQDAGSSVLIGVRKVELRPAATPASG